MRSQIPVDIFTHPGATIDAAAAVDLADRHGMRDLVARLLPYAVAGPTFVPDIHQHLADALTSLRAGRVEDAEHHLEEATQCEPQSWKAVHQPGARPSAPGAVRAPGGLVNVHTYPPKSAATLAISYVFQSRDHATAGDAPYFLGGGNGVARSTWRQRLRDAASRSVAVIAIGGSHGRVDDQRWRTVAANAATTIDKSAPWIAVRRPQPDSVLVFIATARAVTPAIRRRIAAIATSHLLPAPRPGTPSPHTATTATTPPRSHQNPPAGVPHR